MPGVALNTERVWSDLHANIRQFVGRRVREPADADDIVQRVFLRVHRALPALRDEEKLHAWIYQTTRRTIADHYRAPAHRREVPAGSAADLAQVEQPAGVMASEDEASALRELSGCLAPLVSALKAADQQALELVELGGLTQVEAAARLGLSVSGMKSRVQRARAHLREALDACCRFALDRRGGLVSYEKRTGGCDSCGPTPQSSSKAGTANRCG